MLVVNKATCVIYPILLGYDPKPHKVSVVTLTREGRTAFISFIGLLVFSTLILLPSIAYAQSGGQSSNELKILGTKKLSENIQNRWSAQLIRRALTEGPDGYRPTGIASPGGGDPLPTQWEQPVEFFWNFGDGSGIINTKERNTATHIYENDGDYTLIVEARNQQGDSVTGSLEITVSNRRPRLSLPSAIEIDPSTATFELSVFLQDSPGDLRDGIAMSWNFGDGEILEGDDLFTVRHAYPVASTWPVTITATDTGGQVHEKTFNVVSLGGGDASQNPIDSVDSEDAEAELITHFDAKVSGALNTSFSGEILPVAGIHLGPIDQGSKCRFMFTAWDAAKLANVNFIADLAGLPEAEGATYTFNPPRVDVLFHPDKKTYEFAQRGLVRGFASATLVEKLKPSTENLSDQERTELTRLSGLDTSEGEQTSQPPPPEVSPFGLEDKESWTADSGTVKLTFIPYNRAIASMNLSLTNTDKKSPMQHLSLNGDFAMDLESARRNGIMLYEQCKPVEFAIEKTYPELGRRNMHLRQPFFSVNFTEPYDAKTLNESTFQLTYPAAGDGELVPVATRLVRRAKSAFLEPVEDLLGGVRYTVRVKTGPEGVRGLNGAPLKDEDDSTWHRWDFTTRLDLIPDAGVDQNLTCHVLQSVRDAPLIAGKPAVSRIYANWQEHPEVDPDAQLREFTARVVIRKVVEGQNVELGSEFHRFVRPDLWASEGINEAKAEHTANIFWTPDRETPSAITVALEVPQKPGESHAEAYWAQCATPLWELEPELTVDYYVLAIKDWKNVDLLESYLPVLEDIMVEAEIYAEQSFPFKRVHKRFGGIIRHPQAWASCDGVCPQDLLAQFSYQSTADIVIGLMPTGDWSAGKTHSDIDDEDKPAYITLSIDDPPENRDRWVFAVVHEFGHALWLDHLPYVPNEGGEEARKIIESMRDSAWANNGEPVHWHEGIEGFRIARDGKSGFNKSSVEGNEEGSWMTALMFPVTIPYREAFITRHQYLSMQEKLDVLGANQTGN